MSCTLNVKVKDDNSGILSIKFITSKETENKDLIFWINIKILLVKEYNWKF